MTVHGWEEPCKCNLKEVSTMDELVKKYIPEHRRKEFAEKGYWRNKTLGAVSYTHLTLPTTPYV